MLTYVSLILAILKLINTLMDYVNKEALMKAGADAEIAKTSAAILRKTQAGKAIMEKVDAMSNKEVDDGLTALEPK
jgi:hypothetical protein